MKIYLVSALPSDYSRIMCVAGAWISVGRQWMTAGRQEIPVLTVPTCCYFWDCRELLAMCLVSSTIYDMAIYLFCDSFVSVYRHGLYIKG